MSKITVKHYLNDKLKANERGDKKEYPVYVRVSFLRKNFRFRSTFLKWYYSESDFTTTEIKRITDYETQIIEFIVKKNEEIDDLSQYLYLLKYDIIHVVKENILSERVFDKLNFYEKIAIDINDLIQSKTGLDKSAINYILKIDRGVDNDFFLSLDENLIDDAELKKYISLIKILLKFEKEIYKNLFFNIYEWKYNNGRAKFKEYSIREDLNFDKAILLIDNYIDKQENYMFN